MDDTDTIAAVVNVLTVVIYINSTVRPKSRIKKINYNNIAAHQRAGEGKDESEFAAEWEVMQKNIDDLAEKKKEKVSFFF